MTLQVEWARAERARAERARAERARPDAETSVHNPEPRFVTLANCEEFDNTWSAHPVIAGRVGKIVYGPTVVDWICLQFDDGTTSRKIKLSSVRRIRAPTRTGSVH